MAAVTPTLGDSYLGQGFHRRGGGRNGQHRRGHLRQSADRASGIIHRFYFDPSAANLTIFVIVMLVLLIKPSKGFSAMTKSKDPRIHPVHRRGAGRLHRAGQRLYRQPGGVDERCRRHGDQPALRAVGSANWNFATAAFFGIGAYRTGYIANYLDLPFFLILALRRCSRWR